MPLGSPLAGSGRVARTISILCASLSLVGSWGAAEDFVASGTTPLVTSASFPFTPNYSATFGGLLKEGGTLLGLLFSGFATSGGVSNLELLEEEARMAGG